MDRIIIYFSRHARENDFDYIVRKDGSTKEGTQERSNYRTNIDIGVECDEDSEGNLMDSRTYNQNEALFSLISFLILKYDLEPIQSNVYLGRDTKKLPEFRNVNILNEVEDWLMADLKHDFN